MKSNSIQRCTDGQTPRYKASMPLQTQFVTNADATGDQIFTQLRRTNNVALYERRHVSNNELFGQPYEVIVIKTVKAGTIYAKGTKPTEHDTESYPGAASWGKLGWGLQTLDRANTVFDEMVKAQQERIDNPVVLTGKRRGRKSSKVNIVIPDGEFTMKMLMAATGLNQANLHPIVKQWQVDKQIVVVRTIKAPGGRGRPSMVYVKAQ